MDQGNRTEDTETTSCTLGYVTFDKGANHFTGGKVVSLINGARKTTYPHTKAEPKPTALTMHYLKSKQIKI